MMSCRDTVRVRDGWSKSWKHRSSKPQLASQTLVRSVSLGKCEKRHTGAEKGGQNPENTVSRGNSYLLGIAETTKITKRSLHDRHEGLGRNLPTCLCEYSGENFLWNIQERTSLSCKTYAELHSAGEGEYVSLSCKTHAELHNAGEGEYGIWIFT